MPTIAPPYFPNRPPECDKIHSMGKAKSEIELFRGPVGTESLSTYYESFNKWPPDEVNRVFEYFCDMPAKELLEIVVQYVGRDAVVHVAQLIGSKRHPQVELTQVNWSNPNHKPYRYAEFGKEHNGKLFERFEGPTNQQILRADLLAKKLEIPVHQYIGEFSFPHSLYRANGRLTTRYETYQTSDKWM